MKVYRLGKDGSVGLIEVNGMIGDFWITKNFMHGENISLNLPSSLHPEIPQQAIEISFNELEKTETYHLLVKKLKEYGITLTSGSMELCSICGRK